MRGQLLVMSCQAVERVMRCCWRETKRVGVGASGARPSAELASLSNERRTETRALDRRHGSSRDRQHSSQAHSHNHENGALGIIGLCVQRRRRPA
jgi:hypothetical protein